MTSMNNSSISVMDCQIVLKRTQDKLKEIQAECSSIRAAHKEKSSLTQVWTTTPTATELSRAAAESLANQMSDLGLLLKKYSTAHNNIPCISAVHLDDIAKHIIEMIETLEEEEKDRHLKSNVLLGVVQWMEAAMSYIMMMEQKIMEVGKTTTMLAHKQISKSHDVDDDAA
jgi:hypothetical protein